MRNLRNTSIVAAATSALWLLGFTMVLSCGPTAAPTETTTDGAINSDDPSSPSSSNGVNDNSSRKLIQIPTTMTEDLLGLGLVSNSADSFVVSLANCASGLQGNNTSAGVLSVYLSDTSCVAQLTSFVLRGQSYLPSGSDSIPFTTWQPGEKAVFVGSSTHDLVAVIVVKQLSSPIVSTDTVAYTYEMIKSGSGATVTPSPQSTALSVAGMDAPNFRINSGGASLVGIASSGPSRGFGIFTFELICNLSTMTVGTNTSYNSFCPSITAGGTIAGGASGVDIGLASNFSYMLTQDINGDGTLTLSQAQALFAAGGDSTVTLATDLLSGSTGFKTTPWYGPGPIALNSKMLLILQAKNPSFPTDPNYSSFQYFPITVTTFNP